MRALQQQLHSACYCKSLFSWFPHVSERAARPSPAEDVYRQFRAKIHVPFDHTRSNNGNARGNRTFVTRTRAQGGVEATPKKVVFLGTPEVAAMVLKDLIEASRRASSDHEDGAWEVAAVVTQPGRPKGRRNKGVPQPSPVYTCAVSEGIPENMIFCPVKASEEEFISTMGALKPDICVTAAYGNYLPTRFLGIPRYGTLNIHPSLLPLYRGAAPVQRSLQDGVTKTGVTVLFTVKEMDAGPIVAQTEYAVPEDMQAPELLETLFKLGTQSLISCLPKVWNGTVDVCEQDHDMATHAAKMEREEAYLDFSASSASLCHNKVRAFVSWPGTFHTFRLVNSNTQEQDSVEIKILETRVSQKGTEYWKDNVDLKQVLYNGKDAMMVRCDDGTVLEILKLQNPGKKPATASDFNNGLAGRYTLYRS